MKKTFLFLMILMLSAGLAYAAGEDRSTQGFWGREGHVMGRGAINFLTSPSELFYTAGREKETHPGSWGWTVVPQSFMNLIVRISSGAYDLIPLPIMVPFTDNLTPLTRYMDLPDYPWSDY